MWRILRRDREMTFNQRALNSRTGERGWLRCYGREEVASLYIGGGEVTTFLGEGAPIAHHLPTRQGFDTAPHKEGAGPPPLNPNQPHKMAGLGREGSVPPLLLKPLAGLQGDLGLPWPT
jgi:hypothetical protein